MHQAGLRQRVKRLSDQKMSWSKHTEIGGVSRKCNERSGVQDALNLDQEGTEFLVCQEGVPDDSPNMVLCGFHSGFPLAAEMRSARRVEMPRSVFGSEQTRSAPKSLDVALNSRFNSLSAPTKFVPQSPCRVAQIPRRPVKRLYAARKPSVE